MTEVVIVRALKGKIVDTPFYLSQKREQYKKILDTGWERIEKNHGKVSQKHIDYLHEIYELLKQLDQALEGMFNIIVVVKKRWQDALVF